MPLFESENPPAFHYRRLSRELECVSFSLLSLNPAAYFHAAHHFEYLAGALAGLRDSGRRSISCGGRDEWCRCRDLNASDAMLLREAFRASFAPSSFSHLSALNSSSLLFTVTEAVSLKTESSLAAVIPLLLQLQIKSGCQGVMWLFVHIFENTLALSPSMKVVGLTRLAWVATSKRRKKWNMKGQT